MPDAEPRVALEVTVRGDDYDELVAEAHARAAEFLGLVRTYWIGLGRARPAEEVRSADGEVVIAGWEADATIRYPHDPEF